MTSSVFADIGKFTVALLVYLLGTGFVGGVMCLSMDDTDFAPFALWLWGGDKMDDTISRQAAIDAFNTSAKELVVCGIQNAIMVENYLNRVLEKIKNLPSAQSEIILCKDCKYRDPEDRKCDCGHDIQWQLPRQDDWFCADAERRQDER